MLLHQLPGLLATALWHRKGLGTLQKAEMGRGVTKSSTVRKHRGFFLSLESSWKKIWIALYKNTYSVVKSGTKKGDVTLLFSITRKVHLILEVVLSQNII